MGKSRAHSTPYPNVTEAMYFPVQGTAADGMKAGIALLWERRDQFPRATPVLLFVLDEVVVECPDAEAAAVRKWLIAGMVDGMKALLEPVPTVVEASIGRTWGG